jgi:hypothetical protein
MHKFSRESQEAFRGGDGARAKELSNKSKEYRATMERLNREAYEWLFRGVALGFNLVVCDGGHAER